jgi:hypothetical protein
MFLLNPYFLLGLVATGIPIILHFFNLRKLKTIEFSTLIFLKELQKTKIRRLKIRQLILLLLRIFIIVCIVLAFSRPALRGNVGTIIGAAARSTVVVIIDDSYSMTASNSKGELFVQAKETAFSIVDALQEGDEVYLLRLSEFEATLPVDQLLPLTDKNVLRKMISEMQPSYVHKKIDDALRIVARLLTASTNVNREVYIVSDFQSTNFDRTTKKEASPELLFSDLTCVYLASFTADNKVNAGIESATIPTSLFETGKPFLIECRVKNFSSQALKNHAISVYLDGIRIIQRGIDLAAGVAANVEFAVVPSATGFHDVFIELEDDDLQYDNRYFFSVYIPRQINILLAGPPEETRFVQLALATRQGGDTAGFHIDALPASEITSQSLKQHDVVILCGLSELSQTLAQHLNTHLRTRGNLIFFPASRFDVRKYNLSFSDLMELPPVDSVEQTNQQRQFVTFDRVEKQHPLFEDIFEHTADRTMEVPSGRLKQNVVSIESPRITMHVRYAPSPRWFTIISLSNGAPFLIEQKIGSGTAMLFAVAPSPNWSNLPYKSIFVPLVVRTVMYQSQNRYKLAGAVCGSPVIIPLEPAMNSPIRIKAPNNIETIAQIENATETKIVRFNDTKIPGIYSITYQASPIQKFSMNIDPGESDLQPISRQAVDNLLSRIGITDGRIISLGASGSIQRTIQQSRLGIELWSVFVLLAIALAIIETFLAQENKSKTDTGR